MTVKYQHETPEGIHQVLEEDSDVVLDLTGKTVTFWVKPTNGGSAVETPCTLLGAVSPYLFKGDVYGCLIVDIDTAIWGRIARPHAHGVGEDDTGTFSGTHNQ